MFNGTLITIGGYPIPLNYLAEKSYSAERNVQDLDSFRDANGVLHRNALEHIPIKVEIETLELTNTDFNALMTGIKNNYLIPIERKANAVIYVPELDDYITQEVYMVQPKPTINRIDKKTNTIYYEPLKLTFIGY